jgi:hypothetical protein
VDGHDLSTFRRKLERQKHLAAELNDLYEPVLLEGHGLGFSWFVTRWIDGCGIRADLDSELRVKESTLSRRLAGVLEALTARGYQRERASGGTAYLRTEYVQRVLRRLSYLCAALPALLDLEDHAFLAVNGTIHRQPTRLLQQMSDQQRRRATSRWLYYPVHGDLNVGNLLFVRDTTSSVDDETHKADGLRLIDPRGDDRNRDLFYDLGKMLFSLALFDGLRANPSPIRTEVRRDQEVLQVVVTAEASWVEEARSDVAALQRGIADASRYRALICEDDEWEDKLLFALGCHAVAESACRVSQGRLEKSSETAAVNSALACLAFGTYLLNQWLGRGPYRDGPGAFAATREFLNLLHPVSRKGSRA